jgi:hypothetical protein
MPTQPQPGLIAMRIVGISLIALAPVVSAVQFIATRHLYFWAGAAPLFSGLFIVFLNLVLTRRWASGSSRPSATTFREKSAWISFVVILVAFGIYFGLLTLHLLHPESSPHPHFFGLFMLLVVAVVVLEVVLHILVAVRSPADAGAPVDERDRLINLKAARVAFYVLMTGTFLSIGTMHLGATAWFMGNCVFFAIWIAELTRLGSQVVLYRRMA